MTSTESKSRFPDPGEDGRLHGTMLIIVPLIIGAALIVAGVILWEAGLRKRLVSDMARAEEESRDDLRRAYARLRVFKPLEAMAVLDIAADRIEMLREAWPDDYSELETARLLMEGEALFMIDSEGNAAEAEAKFSRAMELLTRASGEFWMFGAFGRGRCRFEMADWEGAANDFSLILERNPNFGAAYYWRSLSRQYLGDAAGAAADAEIARRLDSWPPLRAFLRPGLDGNREVVW